MKKLKTLLFMMLMVPLFADITETIEAGKNVTLLATADGVPPPDLKWFLNDVEIHTGSQLELKPLMLAHAGTYKVVATNSVGSATSENLILVVTSLSAPVFAIQPQNQQGMPGGTVTFTAEAKNGTVSYQWHKDGTAVPGWTNAALTLNALTTNDNGSYHVVASNTAGATASASALLTIMENPTFAVQPVSTNGAPTSTIVLSAEVRGIPAPTLQWKKNGVDVAGATTNKLTLTNVTTAVNGAYTLTAQNTLGATVSNQAWVRVYVAPTISTQPVNTIAKLGEPTSLSVAAATSTFPAPTYQWRKNGTNIVGATSATLSIVAAGKTDTAKYDVVVKNIQGAVTSFAAQLTVHYPPVFITQPKATVTAVIGGNATLSALVDSLPQAELQWMKENQAIAGATAPDLTLTNLTNINAGRYSVLAKNTVGQTWSSDSLLTVSTSVGPNITSPLPTNISIPRNTRHTFIVGATGTGLTYQWYRDSMLLTGFTAPSLTITRMQNRDIGTYRVVVTDSAGRKVESKCIATIR